MGKYDPISHFLSSLRVSRYRANFQELENIIGFKLPRSALKHPAWWSNDETGHSHARSWLHAGWRTEELDLTSHEVTFQRADAAQSHAAPRRDPWGCMANSVTIMPGTNLTEPTGERWNADEAKLLNG